MHLVWSGLGIVGLIFAFSTLVVLVLRLKPQLIFGIYPNKGIFYCVKYPLALLVVWRLRQKLYNARVKKQEHQLVEEWDKPQVLSDNPQSYDVASFTAASAKGEKLFLTIERRRHGLLKACLYLWLPDQGLLCLPKLPDMVYFSTDGKSESEEFKGCGFHIYPEECMHRWRIRYTGDLRRVSDGNQRVSAKLDLQFSSKSVYFNYNRDLSAAVIADSIAREAWNNDFYYMLKSVDRILDKRLHYEQVGELQGDIHIADQVIPLQLRSIRDHSFGTERCLSTINRYVYCALFLDDGTTMVVGNLSQPLFFLSSLKVGYVCTSDPCRFHPITACNFELYSYGERGTPPQHQNFVVHTAHAEYFVQIKAEHSAVRYVGVEWESKVYNQFVTCRVNGVQGQGLTEYLYRNKEAGRPASVSSTDPEWYKRVRTFERTLSTGIGRHAGDDDTFIF